MGHYQMLLPDAIHGDVGQDLEPPHRRGGGGIVLGPLIFKVPNPESSPWW